MFSMKLQTLTSRWAMLFYSYFDNFQFVPSLNETSVGQKIKISVYLPPLVAYLTIL
jgi:hypothetical protein